MTDPLPAPGSPLPAVEPLPSPVSPLPAPAPRSEALETELATLEAILPPETKAPKDGGATR